MSINVKGLLFMIVLVGAVALLAMQLSKRHETQAKQVVTLFDSATGKTIDRTFSAENRGSQPVTEDAECRYLLQGVIEEVLPLGGGMEAAGFRVNRNSGVVVYRPVGAGVFHKGDTAYQRKLIAHGLAGDRRTFSEDLFLLLPEAEAKALAATGRYIIAEK